MVNFIFTIAAQLSGTDPNPVLILPYYLLKQFNLTIEVSYVRSSLAADSEILITCGLNWRNCLCCETRTAALLPLRICLIIIYSILKLRESNCSNKITIGVLSPCNQLSTKSMQSLRHVMQS